MVKSLAEILMLQKLIDTATRDTTCRAKYPAVPKRFAIVVPGIKCLVQADKLSTSNTLNTKKWKMQMDFLELAHSSYQRNCLELDRQLLLIPSDLENNVRVKFYGSDEEPQTYALNIARQEFDRNVSIRRWQGAYDDRQGYIAETQITQQILSSKKKADAKFVAKNADKVDTFRTLARTEYQLLNAEAANNATEVERLQNQRPGHTVQFASALRLNAHSPKSRGGGNRAAPKRQQKQPGQQPPAKKAKNSKPKVTFIVTAPSQKNPGRGRSNGGGKGKGRGRGRGKRGRGQPSG